MNKEIGNRIALLLKQQDMTQRDLAERICVDETIISRYISGEREIKSNVLANIATALNTTSDYLLGIEKEGFSFPGIKRVLARNSKSLTDSEKKQLIDALFGEED